MTELAQKVDYIVDQAGKLLPVEIKSSQTINSDLFDSLKKWQELTQTPADTSYLVYGGDITQSRAQGNIVSWRASGALIKKITGV